MQSMIPQLLLLMFQIAAAVFVPKNQTELKAALQGCTSSCWFADTTQFGECSGYESYEAAGYTCVETTSMCAAMDPENTTETCAQQAPRGYVLDVNSGTCVNALNLVCMHSDGSDAINEWDVSRIANMAALFKNMDHFNANISSWNTSSVTTFR